jgi:hypothetical protein
VVNLRRTSSLKQRWMWKEHYSFLYQSECCLGCGFKRVFDLLVKHAAEYPSIPPGALRTYWLRRVLVSLQYGRANTPSFYDECLGQGVVLAQSHVGSVSVSNRRRGLG